MSWRAVALVGLVMWGGCCAIGQTAVGQEQTPEPSAGAKRTVPQVPRVPAPPTKSPPRVMAPHVFKRIHPCLESIDILSLYDPVGLEGELGEDFEAEMDKYHMSRHVVWYLEIEIKELRTITVYLPDLVRKTVSPQKVWYLIYKVRNPGVAYVVKDTPLEKEVTDLRKVVDVPFPLECKNKEIEVVDNMTLRFNPLFVLKTNDERLFNDKTKAVESVSRSFRDRFMPLAAIEIRKKEDPNRTILDSVQMSRKQIKPGEEVWGVATWTGINPNVDTFNIFVSGLTNAAQWDGPPQTGKVKQRILKLYYWHPGDSDIFRLTSPGGLDYEWIFE
ncbi:MAG: hypothetical protein Q4D38_10405 [Planctomycetia bacterium]|nr:hypothetical protein [Planctomycetia bacterium]